MYGPGLRAISRDCLEDGIGCLGPDERLGVVIVGLNKGSDIGFELIDAAMDAALDLLVGEQREPAFDLVEPGGAGRREVEVVARLAGEPGFDDLGMVDRARRAWSRFVEQPVEAALDKAPTPLADGLHRHPLARRNRLVA